mmetsp:Transcript_11503/g.46573  ORF Transcript_11503/g.46573 Transcript_11503/m.46573 type:complete len:281 (-) Transcript_11503:222-1064(-)
MERLEAGSQDRLMRQKRQPPHRRISWDTTVHSGDQRRSKPRATTTTTDPRRVKGDSTLDMVQGEELNKESGLRIRRRAHVGRRMYWTRPPQKSPKNFFSSPSLEALPRFRASSGDSAPASRHICMSLEMPFFLARWSTADLPVQSMPPCVPRMLVEGLALLYFASYLFVFIVWALPSLKARMPKPVVIQPLLPLRSLLSHEPPRCMYGTSLSAISPLRTLAGFTGMRCFASPFSSAATNDCIDRDSNPRAPALPKSRFAFFAASSFFSFSYCALDSPSGT